MSFTVNALANLLFAYIDQSGTAGPSGDVANATATEKKFIALAITQALKDARKLNPSMFAQRPGIVLRAPISGTITLTQYSTATTLGTLTVPNDGCTFRVADGFDNELNVTATPGTYALRREYEGASGTPNATIYHDCWVAADGSSFDAVLGDVRANGCPLKAVTDASELDRYRLFNDFGVVSISSRRPDGQVQAVLCEQWASPYTKKIQTRLRFSPMPSAATVIDATLAISAPIIADTDLSSTSILFQIPQALDETILFPLAMRRFLSMPMMRPTSDMRAALLESAALAENTLKLMRGFIGAPNSLTMAP